MTTKAEELNLHQKLMACRIDLQGCQLKKSGNNKFAGYDYFELQDFLPKINELFNKYGLIGITSFDSEYATLTICDTDKPAEQIVFSSPMAAASLKGCHEIQNLGATETYQRRYLYMIALEITDACPVDSSPPTTKEKPVKSVNKKTYSKPVAGDTRPATEPQVRAIFGSLKRVHNITGGSVKKAVSEFLKRDVDDIAKLSMADASLTIDFFNNEDAIHILDEELRNRDSEAEQDRLEAPELIDHTGKEDKPDYDDDLPF